MQVLGEAGLRVDALWPQEHWTVFDSLAAMPGPVSRPTRWVLRVLARLERAARARQLHAGNRWLRAKPASMTSRELLAVTGQVDFLAVKP